VLNNKPYQKMDGTRRSLYEQIDKPALKHLPEMRYVFAEWKKATVNIDYHIAVDHNLYLTLKNPFFVRRVVCRSDLCTAPEIRVEPAPSEEDLLSTIHQERQRRGAPRTLLTGQDTRMFRPYQSGDDARFIDWKLTARYQEYYVRVPERHLEGSPLLIVDLPEYRAPSISERHARFLTRVTGILQRALDTYDSCSLLLISGGEVKGYHPPSCEREIPPAPPARDPAGGAECPPVPDPGPAHAQGPCEEGHGRASRHHLRRPDRDDLPRILRRPGFRSP